VVAEPTEADYVRQRRRLVARMKAEGYVQSRTVEEAFLRVPRERFVLPDRSGHAYVDAPLPIPRGQTISAPSMIAIMLEEAKLGPGDAVLEIGTGSGYNAALLAEIVGQEHVVSIERSADLAAWGRANLQRAGYDGVEVVVGDGSLGYAGRAPYDCIFATAGAPRLPKAWGGQLKIGGRIVAPVGGSSFSQVLTIATKGSDGRLDVRRGVPCAFVPLVGEEGW
jgi:protein-L-isoaspartate(D-aspartate) O-methyltransferase